MSSLLEISGLSIWFRSRGMERLVVSDLSLSISAGEVLGLVGESGSGKSVTALAILRLLDAAARVEGSILFDGVDLLALPNEEMRKRRGREIAMIFQEPMTALNPVMTIGEQVAEAIRAHQTGLSRKQVRQTVVEALEAVAIPEAASRYGHYPHQFSGGQRQRILIAMAIANRPKLLIADEPTTALDVTVQAQILGAAGGFTAAVWLGDAVHLSRSRGGFAGGRPGDGDAAWAIARERSGARGLSSSSASLYGQPAWRGADDGDGQKRSVGDAAGRSRGRERRAGRDAARALGSAGGKRRIGALKPRVRRLQGDEAIL